MLSFEMPSSRARRRLDVTRADTTAHNLRIRRGYHINRGVVHFGVSESFAEPRVVEPA